MPFLVEVELKGARLTGHDHFWKVIRELGEGGREFTIADVVGETVAHRDSVGDFIRRLCRTEPPIAESAGWRQVRNRQWGPGKVRARTYRLLRAPVETPSLRRDGATGLYGRKRQAMWNILRGPQARSGIDARELAFAAETAELPIAIGTATEYLRKLERAGVLQLVAAGRHAGRGASALPRYRLPPGSFGPKAPKLLKTELIYDPNTRQLVGSAPCTEVGQ